jgi:hypothetical protein
VGPIPLNGDGEYGPWDEPELGYMVTPGDYVVTMYLYQDRELAPFGTPQSFECTPLNMASLPAEDLDALHTFNEKVAALARAISAADAHRGRLEEKLPYLERAMLGVGAPDAAWLSELSAIRIELFEIDEALNGDRLLVMDEGQPRMSLKGRTDLIISSLWTTTSAPTGTYERAYREAHDGFDEVLAMLEQVDGRIEALEGVLEAAGAPYTPGRLPVWQGHAVEPIAGSGR